MKAEFNTCYMKLHKPNLTLNQGNNPTCDAVIFHSKGATVAHKTRRIRCYILTARWSPGHWQLLMKQSKCKYVLYCS